MTYIKKAKSPKIKYSRIPSSSSQRQENTNSIKRSDTEVENHNRKDNGQDLLYVTCAYKNWVELVALFLYLTQNISIPLVMCECSLTSNCHGEGTGLLIGSEANNIE